MDKQDQNAMLQGRTHADAKRWNSHIAGKEFYQLRPGDKNQFRTIWIKNNPFTGKNEPKISNWVTGIPPSNIPHIHPLMLQRLMTLQSEGDFF